MSYEGGLGVFEQNSGEIMKVTNDVIVENDNCVNSSYIIMGHAGEDLRTNGAANFCYTQLGETINDGSIIFNDIKSVEEWLKSRTDLESNVDLDLSRSDDWWNFSTTEIVTTNNDVNEIIPLPSITGVFNNETEDANVSSVNWEDYVLDTENCINTTSILSNSFLLVPTNTEQSYENDLEIHKVDGYLNSPNVIVNSPPTKSNNASDICDISRETVNKEVSCESIPINCIQPVSQINIQDNLKKLPFVKVPKDCLARGKILGKQAISLFVGDNSLYNKYKLLSPSKTQTELSKQQSLLNKTTLSLSPTNKPNDANVKGKRAVVILPVQSANKNQIPVDSLPKAKHPRSLLKINNTSSNHSVQSETFRKDTIISSSKSRPSVTKSPLAVVAISTDKANDTTEIVIKTHEGENLFKGKTSDIMKATGSTDNLSLQHNSLNNLKIGKNHGKRAI